MTIKDVQWAVTEIRIIRTKGFPDDGVEQRLFERVLQAIADSNCQDSPAELAAEALKVMNETAPQAKKVGRRYGSSGQSFHCIHGVNFRQVCGECEAIIVLPDLSDV